ncbi:hypothetical protein [Streptomyces sp. NBC_00239]|uniref:hypothetical protein n=1 Tax=Streptomyces sp. NBC_00239 TaxID=2903640 RepID=UPI002E2AC5D7|nr:hypothetical protein [Streptomyces sp. NBC_00239]
MTTLIRVTRVATATMAVLALAASAAPALAAPVPGSPGPFSGARAAAADGLPEGWQFTGTGNGRQLVWTSADTVPMGDARVEFYDGDRLLGRPSAGPDGRTFRLRADGARFAGATDLRVVAGGRRLDARGAAAAPQSGRTTVPSAQEAPLPANAVDPGKAGNYRTADGAYTLKSVKLPGYAAPVEMRATVVGPTNAPGKRPVVLFLHGRHSVCYIPGGELGGEWPCKNGTKPIPSERGYLQSQKLLASQGYVTVSIAANGINAQDHLADDAGAQARSSLVRLHLARWADWSADRSGAPAAVRALAPADLSRVMLVGHSRGGEGVNRAALDSLEKPPASQDGYRGPVRWKIRGNVLIGPTVFGQNPVPDVPSMTILPGCDGDVSDLQGQIYADGTRGVSRGAALHSSVYMVGANHNFFNTEWTPGQAAAPADDDFWPGETPDPVCGVGKKTRLTAAQQQTAGATYIAAAARLFVAGDDRVRPLLDGSNRRAPSADPARVLTHAVGAHRTPAFLPDPTTTVTGGRVCAQIDPDPKRACLPSGEHGGSPSPHFASWETMPEPGRDAMVMQWSRAGSPVTVRPARPVSLAGAESLALRVFVPPNTTGTKLDVTVVDAAGKRATLGRATVDGLPGTERTSSYWAREVRVPLAAAVRAGLDLKHVKSLELTPRTASGKAWLMDAWGWRPGTPAVKPAGLTRVDIGRLQVKEGDSGTKTYRIPVQVTGHGSGQLRLFVPKPGTDQTTSRLVTVRPGSQAIDVPVSVTGNTRFGSSISSDIFVKAVRGVAVGSHRGGVTALNDDPMPKVTMTPVAGDVVEGKKLTWRVALSAVSDSDMMYQFDFAKVTDGTELSTKDVDPVWLKETFDQQPDPERPLSKMLAQGSPSLWFHIPAGKLRTDVTVPTVADRVREPAETVRGQLFMYDEQWNPKPGPVVTGTVRDAS